ncbi:MAG TPA: hypothetical protein VGO02_08305 [Burkholderiales bacterium]|nr:hypothetical protein [Burkholderiales bacterium]
MHCELIVPSLFATATEARYPALELLLARGRRESAESRTLEQWLRQAFEQPGEALAAGALSLAAHGGSPGERWWARADPVHLRVMRDRAIVAPGEALEVASDEADALVEALNRHFAGAVEFRVLEPRRWVARLEPGTGVTEGPALYAAGRDAAIARGEEGLRAALLTEIQMLLHAHPVNEAREARGEPALNSLWIWGGGQPPRAAHGPWRSVAAADPSALGLAQLAGMRGLDLPPSAAAWLDLLPVDGRHLAVLDVLRVPTALEQQAEYGVGIEALERLWFAPLLAALRAERIGMVTLRVPDAAPGAGFETVRGDLRRFWRRPRALGRYA